MARTEYKFQYMPLEGRLPGKVMEQQTEDAINDLGIWLVDVSETADNATTLAQDAYDRAIDAQSTADNAQSAADNAQSTADEAMRAAAAAQSAGDQAQASADEAMAAAKAAQESADHAQESADAAQESANTAQESADKAQGTAEVAQDSADAAQTTADTALSSLNEHADDTNNPHQVTAAQLGLASAYVYRGTVDEYADLPEDAEVGDVYNVVNADEEHGIKAGDNVAWTGEGWDNLSGVFDASGLETEISEVLQVANNAQEAASTAQSTADAAQASADSAATAATNAQSAAEAAQATADTAQSNAETAKQTADDAVTAAATAQTTADDALQRAIELLQQLLTVVNDVEYADSTLTVTKADGTTKEFTIAGGGGGLSGTVGSSTKPVWLNDGEITACSSTVGSATQPIYSSSGTLTACNTTVGGTAKPIYSNAGVLTAISSTVGSGTVPIYSNGGTLTASSSTVGSATKPVYLNSGTITASGSTVGSASIPVYLNSGTITQCTAASTGTIAGSSYGSNGYVYWTSGLCIQWGYTTTNGKSVSFPTSFSTVYSFTATGYIASSASEDSTNVLNITALSASAFTVSRSSGLTGIYWIAVGKK